MTLNTRVIIPALALVFGVGFGTLLGPTRSEAGGGISRCFPALDFATQEMEASADFALAVTKFIDAQAAKNSEAMQEVMAVLGGINERALAATAGFIASAPACR